MQFIRHAGTRTGCGALAVVCFCFVISSCSRGRLSVYPVQGQIIYEGKPAEGAWVFFNPTDSSTDTDQTHPPYGIADGQGNFELTSYSPGDGAPAGDYAVTVVLRKETGRGDAEAEGEDLIPPRYADALTSGLQATVEKHAMRLEPFKLFSQGWKPKACPRRDAKRTTAKAGH
jgi:hypothetical protein